MTPSPKALTALAGSLGLALSGAAQAEFIKDSKAALNLRNFYINNDVRNEARPSIEEWGQGFMLDFKSGYTEGPVGLGVDALGLWGVRLDSGGDADKAGIERTPGSVFPLQSNGQAVGEFGRVGLTGKLRISKTEARVGTLLPKLPVLIYNDSRLLPQTFEGEQITSKEFDKLTLIGGQIERATERNSTDSRGLSIAGANSGAKAQDSNKFYYGGADYQIDKNLLAQYYYANLQDFYKQHFLGLIHTLALPVGSLKTDLRYFASTSDGKNASAAGRAAGYTSTGYYGVDAKGNAITKGEVDNRLWSAQFTYSLEGHALSAGYQQVSGNSDFPHINDGQGRTLYLLTNAQLHKFHNAGEKTWVLGYAYDFAKLGAPGLKASANYFNGRSIDDAQYERQEWERDLRVDYVLQDGPLKGLGFAWQYAMWRGNDLGQRDQDEHRLILNYSLALF
ncbi:MAG TPA: OprD family porin [Pseudomonas sp.]|nr:OprD family porin [Pseudomonas sp.]